MLWLAVHLPMFALEVSQAGQSTRAPTVLVDDNRVLLANRAARQAGIGLQISLATAHGICPSLVHYRRDPVKELKRLRLLAVTCYRFTSRVSLEPPGNAQAASALLLEASGSLELFGPMDGWQSQVDALCHQLGHEAVLRAAATPSAALALARAGASRLPDVPLAHTALSEAEVESLSDMGIRTLGPLLQLPQAELGQRFGAGLTNYLQRLTGTAPDPRPCIEPEPVFESSLNLPDPITDKNTLLLPMQCLLTELEHWLIGRQLGAAGLLWRFAPHEAAAGVSMPVRFAAARQRKAEFIEIVRLALDRAELPENVLEIGLKAKSLAPWTTRSQTLFEPLPGQPTEENPPAALIDRFTAHLGKAGCSTIATTGQHIPEQAWKSLQPGSTRGHPSHKKSLQPGSARGHPSHKKSLQPGSTRGHPSYKKSPQPGSTRGHPSYKKSLQPNNQPKDSLLSRSSNNRPLWFFDAPRRIDRKAFEILSGPERLQTGWWGVPARIRHQLPAADADALALRGHAGRRLDTLATKVGNGCGLAEGRDYYVVRLPSGARGWAFAVPDGRWFLHGYFS